MRCISCSSLSFWLICKECQKRLLAPSLFKRELEDGFVVYSFFEYSSITHLLYSKYEPFGSEILKILAKNSFSSFAKEFEFDGVVYAIPLDDNPRKNYSHTAILAKALKSRHITPIYGMLKAKNRVSYAGKSLQERLQNPREFEYTGKSDLSVILVDDIITTGVTMKEAKSKIQESGCEPLFGLVLSDARS